MSPHEMRKRAVNAVQKGMHVNDVTKAYHKNCSIIYRRISRTQSTTTK